MDPKELRDLVEAYSEVYVPQEEIEEASYSAKAARAGKDIGKPGKQFAKIAKEAGKRYGSKERGEKVAGAVLAKLRAEDVDIFDVVLEFLQAEGFAETLEEAEWLMANVIDEEAIDAILETRMDPRGRPASGPMNVYAKNKPNRDPAFLAALEKVRADDAKKTPEQRKKELDAYKERQRNK
jgi:hypothetical protein